MVATKPFFYKFQLFNFQKSLNLLFVDPILMAVNVNENENVAAFRVMQTFLADDYAMFGKLSRRRLRNRLSVKHRIAICHV